MTLNAKIGVLWIFWRFWTATHISRANCTEIARDRPGQVVYETFSIIRSFHLFKFCPPAFKDLSVQGCET